MTEDKDDRNLLEIETEIDKYMSEVEETVRESWDAENPADGNVGVVDQHYLPDTTIDLTWKCEMADTTERIQQKFDKSCHKFKIARTTRKRHQ